MAAGKLIVLEGIDGSGKSTQYRLLCEKMDKAGLAYHHIVFPRYAKESSALIRLYLSGGFGQDPGNVNPYAASTFYAVDRYASFQEDWGESYRRGELILSDRYTTSNAVHQGSKLKESQLPTFFDWLSDLEYVKMGLPEPGLVIYLDVSLPVALERMRRRQGTTGVQADIHEKNTEYLARCLRTAELAASHFGWRRISWEKNGAERDPEEKSQEIFRMVQEYLGRQQGTILS